MPNEAPTWEQTADAPTWDTTQDAAPTWENTKDYRPLTEYHPPAPTLPGGLNDPGAGTEFVSEVARDPVGFLKATPEIAFGALAAPGKLAYQTAADVVSKVAGQPEYGGNLRAGMTGEDSPVEKFIGSAAKTNPGLATTANIGKALPEIASMLALNPGGVAGRLLAAGFSVDAIRNFNKTLTAYNEEADKPEPDAGKLAELRAQAITLPAFALLAGHGAVKDLGPTLAEARTAFDNANRLIPGAARGRGSPAAPPTWAETKPISEEQGTAGAEQKPIQSVGEQPAPPPEPVAAVYDRPTGADTAPLQSPVQASEPPLESAIRTPHSAIEQSAPATAEATHPTENVPGAVASSETAPAQSLREAYLAEQQRLAEPFIAKGGESAKLGEQRLAEAQRVVALPEAEFQDYIQDWKPLPKESPVAPREPKLVPVEVTEPAIKSALDKLERPPDILDDIEQHFGGVRITSQADYGNYKKLARGKAKELMQGGEPADLVVDGLNRLGGYKLESQDDLLDAMVKAGEARLNQRGKARGQAVALAQEMARYDLFRKAALRATRLNTEPVPVSSLAPGDTFKLDGHDVTVEAAHVDPETGAPAEVRLTGAYGTQHVSADTTLHVDAGTLQQPVAEFVGLGGAVKAEFQPGRGTATGIKNAQVDAERQARGLEPLLGPARLSNAVVYDRTMARIDAEPEWQDRLISELRSRPRTLTPEETLALDHRYVDLQNTFAKVTRDLAQAYDDAQAFPNRLADVEELKLRQAALSDQLTEFEQLTRDVGTEWGRSGQIRQRLMKEDFSLAAMEMQKRAANEGRPLTDTERAEIIRLNKQIEEMSAKATARETAINAERAKREAAEEINRVIDTVVQTPSYDRQVLSIVERFSRAIDQEAIGARARLKAKFARLSSGVDPTILADLTIIGVQHIKNGIGNIAHFTKKFADEFGPEVLPWINQVWGRANARIDEAAARSSKGKQLEAVKRAVRKEDTTGTRQNIIAGLKNAASQSRPLAEIGDYVRKLAENYVRSGVKERDALIDAVHRDLTEFVDPQITRRQAMDAISGYGDFKPLNPDAIKTELRDLRGQMQQIAKLEDLQARQPLQKTGVERRVPSDTERRLIQQVNEAKRKFGVVTTDPASQLKSALASIKTRLQNQIADFEFQIATKQKTVKERTPAPFDAETRLLEARRDELKQQFLEIFPKPDLTDTQRAEIATKALERSIADYETRIAAGDVSVQAGKPLISTPRLEALRARRDGLRGEWEELRDVLDPARRDAVALAAYKSRLLTQAAEYTDRLARGDFAPRKRYAIKPDAEALGYKAKAEAARREFQRGLILDRMRQRSLGAKIYAGVKEGINLPRNILSSWDVSAVLRQGGFITIGNPLRAARSIAPMFRALASEHQSRVIEQEILSRPNAPLYRKSKLYLAPLESLHLSAMEEQIMSTLADRIPGVRASNRAYISFLNKLRADSFDQMMQSVQRRGGNLNQPELEAVANYINVATGRGNLGRAAPAAETLATVFFSPRLVASRFQILAGEPLYRGSARTRAVVAGEYGKFLLGMAVIYGLGQLAGAVVEPDPRSADFGKLRFGNTRVDPLAGLSQNTVVLSRLVSGETKNTAGKLQAIRGDVDYGHSNAADIIARFLRSKLSPVVGNLVDVASGENVVGEKVTPKTVASNLLIPLSFHDIADVMHDQGVERGTALAVLSLFGFGLQYYEARPPANSPQEKFINARMRALKGGTPEARKATREQIRAALLGTNAPAR